MFDNLIKLRLCIGMCFKKYLFIKVDYELIMVFGFYFGELEIVKNKFIIVLVMNLMRIILRKMWI